MKVFISGLSGTGKTTIGKRLVEILNADKKCQWIFKDQDDFFLPEKPRTAPIFSNGRTKSNWDCVEAIDWVELNKYLKEHSEDNLRVKPEGLINVVFVGFCLRSDLITTKPDIHFHLNYGTEDLVDICCKSRASSKKFETVQDRIDDEIMVKKVIMPFYFETFRLSKFDYMIYTIEQGNRVSVDILVEQIKNLLSF